MKFLVPISFLIIGLFSIPAAAALPSGYTEMGWLYANGKQWTLSGYTPSCTDRIEMKVRINGVQYYNYTLFCSSGTTTSTDVMKCFVRGGYAGTAGEAFSSGNSVSVIDGQNTLNTIVYMYHSASLRQKFERLEFVRAVQRAIHKGVLYYANGHLTVKDCHFIGNGTTFDTQCTDPGGCAIYASGVSASNGNRLWVTNCVFAGNALFKSSPRTVVAGSGIYVLEYESAVIMDCTFLTDGVAWRQPLVAGTPTVCLGGAAIHSVNTPTALVSCKFIGNRTVSTSGSAAAKSVVTLLNSQEAVPWMCGLTNCLFLANAAVAANKDRLIGPAVGTVVIWATKPLDTADLVNCTFAYNLMDTIEGTGGLCVYKGAAKVRNPIFYGNRIARSRAYGSELRLIDAAAFADVDYTLFGSTAESNVYKVVEATLSMGEHVYEGDP